MIILGIDPGTAITGFGIIKSNKNRCLCISYGQIKTDKSLSLSDRLGQIESDLEEIIKKYKPEAAAVEQLFFYKNITTAISVAHARGVIINTLRKNHIRLFEYTPLQVKQGLTGYGKADKKQVQQMVAQELKLEEIPRPDDAADALGIAIICNAELQKTTLSKCKKHTI